MLRRLVDPNCTSHDDKYIEGGMTPWHTIYVIKSQQAGLQRYTKIFNLLVGGNTVSYANMDKFNVIDEHVSLHIKFSQVKMSLELYVLV